MEIYLLENRAGGLASWMEKQEISHLICFLAMKSVYYSVRLLFSSIFSRPKNFVESFNSKEIKQKSKAGRSWLDLRTIFHIILGLAQAQKGQNSSFLKDNIRT